MNLIFTLILYYPVWAVPVALAAIQLGVHYRRRKSRNQFFCWFLAFLMLASSGAWVYYRGDAKGAQWLRDTFGIERVQWD